MSPWIDNVFNASLSVVLALIAAGLFTSRINKKKIAAETNNTDVSAAAQLSQAALSILTQARLDAESAGQQARESRVEAERARADIRTVRNELETLRDYLRFIVVWVQEQGLVPPTREEMERRRAKDSDY